MRVLSPLRLQAGYFQRVKNVFGPSLVAYWPLDEAAGAVGYDRSGGAHNAAYTNVHLLQPGIGDGRTGASLPGDASATLNAGSQLNPHFNGDLGSVSLWAQFDQAHVDEHVHRWFVQFKTTSSDVVRLWRNDTHNIICWHGDKLASNYYTGTGWFQVGMTWSVASDRVRCYINGYLAGTVTGLRSLNGGLNPDCLLGRDDTSTYWMYGNLAHVALGNTELTPSQMSLLAGANGQPNRITIIGDSLSLWAAHLWTEKVISGRPNSYGVTHGVSGAHVIHDGVNTDFADEVAAAVSDDATIILVLLGTNDAQDTQVYEDTYYDNLVQLTTDHPRAAIYGLGLLDRSVMTNIVAARLRIQSACSRAGVSYVPTDGWIVPATDTTDGLHLNQSGNDKVAAAVLAML